MKLKLKLTVDVTYDTNAEGDRHKELVDILRRNLNNIVNHAYAHGGFTGDTEAEVDDVRSAVEEEP